MMEREEEEEEAERMYPRGTMGLFRALHRRLSRQRWWLGFALAGLLASACANPQPGPLRLGIVPAEGAQATAAAYAPLARYLERSTGRTWEVATLPTATALIDAMAGGRVHLASLGALTYLQAADKAAARPIARGIAGGHDMSHAVIVVPSESPVRGIPDLAGATLAFGDVGSVTAHLVPHYALLVGGVDPRRHLRELPRYTGSDTATLLAIAAHAVDAGAADESALEALVSAGHLDQGRLRVVWRSEALPTAPWILIRRVDPALTAAIQDALLAIRPQDGLLPPQAGDSFTRASEADYAGLRRMATELGFLSQPEPTPAR